MYTVIGLTILVVFWIAFVIFWTTFPSYFSDEVLEDPKTVGNWDTAPKDGRWIKAYYSSGTKIVQFQGIAQDSGLLISTEGYSGYWRTPEGFFLANFDFYKWKNASAREAQIANETLVTGSF